MRTGLLLLLLLATPALADPGLILFPAIGTPRAVRISGRVLKEPIAEGSTSLTRNVRRLAQSNLAGAALSLEFAGRAESSLSEEDGAFEVTFSAPAGAPFPVGVHEALVRAGPTEQRVRVQVVADEAPFLVVSDFDDTVAVTNVTSKRGLVKAALLQDEATQPAVDGMSAFYRCLVAPRVPASAPALAFVSGSPVQFVPRISAFLAAHAFPFAALALRDLGPTTLSGYKQPILRRLLTQFAQPVVLVGDSGEADPEVYAQVRREFPGRVRRVYIRDAGRSTEPKRFGDMLLFANARDAAADAVSQGLVDPGCVAEAFAR